MDLRTYQKLGISQRLGICKPRMTRNKRGKEENAPHGNPGCEGEAISLVGYRRAIMIGMWQQRSANSLAQEAKTLPHEKLTKNFSSRAMSFERKLKL